MRSRKARPEVPVDRSGKSPLGTILSAVGIALLVTVGLVISVNQTLHSTTAAQTVWKVIQTVPAGEPITKADVQPLSAPAGLAGMLYSNAKAPVGKVARVSLFTGVLLASQDLGGKGISVPKGDVGVWVATTPNEDGIISLGEFVVPYYIPTANSNVTKAKALTTSAVQIVSVSDSSGTPQTSGGSGTASAFAVSGAPVAVEIAVPTSEAALVVDAAAQHNVAMAVPGGIR